MNSSSLRRASLPAVAVLTVGLTLTACGNNNGSSSSNGLTGGGATSQTVAEGVWRANFQKANKGVTVNYEEVGSGTGVSNFTSKAYSFAGSDAYLTTDQLTAATKTCGAAPIEVPGYVSPIAVAFKLSGVTSLNMDAATLANIFNGTITKWNDPAIAKLNKGAKLPSTAISTVHRSDESGTTFNFTDYLSKASGGAWSDAANTIWPASLSGGQGLAGTSGVIGGIGQTDGAIGYADNSAVASASGLGVVKLQVGKSFNSPSAAGAAKVLAKSPAAASRPATDMATDIDRTYTGKGGYPLMLVSYLLACPTYSDKTTADQVKGFLTYVVSSEGQQAAAKTAGSAPLAASLLQKASAIVSKITAN